MNLRYLIGGCAALMLPVTVCQAADTNPCIYGARSIAGGTVEINAEFQPAVEVWHPAGSSSALDLTVSYHNSPIGQFLAASGGYFSYKFPGSKVPPSVKFDVNIGHQHVALDAVVEDFGVGGKPDYRAQAPFRKRDAGGQLVLSAVEGEQPIRVVVSSGATVIETRDFAPKTHARDALLPTVVEAFQSKQNHCPGTLATPLPLPLSPTPKR